MVEEMFDENVVIANPVLNVEDFDNSKNSSLTLEINTFGDTSEGEETLSSDDEELSEEMTICHRTTIVIFACLGMYVVSMTRLYPSGFYVDFLQQSGFSTIIGTVSISATFITSPAGPYIYNLLPKTTRNASLLKRYLCVSMLNLICSSMMALIRVFIDTNSGASVLFGTIALLRGFQGVAIGIMLVFVQGEVIDLYLKEDKKAMILISSFVQFGAVFSSILGTELFVAGGWVLVSFGTASFNILPLLVLPLLTKVKESCRKIFDPTDKESPNSTDRSKNIVPQPISLWLRNIALYFPDLMLFLNNAICDFIMYLLPARILYSSALSVSSAVQLVRIFSLVSFISALTLSFIAGRIKKFNVISTMAIGNAVYYGGAVVAFGATTCDFKFLELTHQLLIGLILMGLGEGFSFNLYTPSKFYLYKKWSVDNSGLGEQSAKIFNIVLNLASAMGTAVSALSLTEESEIPTIAAISGIGIF